LDSLEDWPKLTLVKKIKAYRALRLDPQAALQHFRAGIVISLVSERSKTNKALRATPQASICKPCSNRRGCNWLMAKAGRCGKLSSRGQVVPLFRGAGQLVPWRITAGNCLRCYLRVESESTHSTVIFFAVSCTPYLNTLPETGARPRDAESWPLRE